MPLLMLNIQEHVSLKPCTVFKIGGPARYFCEIQSINGLQELVEWTRVRNLPFMVLGAGSNVLISDEGYSGLVIRLLVRDIEKRSGERLYIAAGASVAAVVNFTVRHGLGGFEWAIGIPGTVGGSVFGNAGCYGSEMKDVVESAEILDTSTMALQHYGNTACDFSYRNSIFKQHPEWIIVGAVLKLVRANQEECRAKILEYTKKRVQTQDIGSQCAGCIFKNFIPPDGGAQVSAGKLIDEAGLKGTKIGGAMVSFKHGNFIINTGNATAKDIKQLIALIKEKIKKKHGIVLEEEIRFVGQDIRQAL